MSFLHIITVDFMQKIPLWNLHMQMNIQIGLEMTLYHWFLICEVISYMQNENYPHVDRDVRSIAKKY